MENAMTKEYRRTVLVVDDEEVNREMLGEILSTEYDVIHAVDGKEALSKIEQAKDTLSLVLLDLLMPNIDGYSVLLKMQENEDLRKIPVIVLTSEKSAEVKSLQMGAADFLSKPYDLPELILARVKHSITLFEDNKLIKATETDSLTGLYNKEFFLEYCLQYDKMNAGKQMDAVVINFNRFHLLNELYGREYGDKILKAMADQIRTLVAEDSGLACRYSGDSFYLYKVHHWNLDIIVDRIKFGLSKLLQSSEIWFRIGVYNDLDKSISIEQKFARAQQACNSIRDNPGSSFVVYDMAMHKKSLFTRRLLREFDKAIKEKQFKVFYQPKYNVKGNISALCSVEALVRWEHPQVGFIRPDLFIPLFESNGLVQTVDRYVWETAARQQKEWQEKLGMLIPVSVNVSRVDLYDSKVVDYLSDIVSKNGLKPENYLLEITESAYTENSRQIVDVVKELRSRGFKIEMDDFGSGYSSLNMLATLPIDALKLDRAFISNLKMDSKELRMVELILDIARYLKVPVIAEGVETRVQYLLLKQVGCEIIQGFYFSKPLPPDEIVTLVKEGIKK